MPKITICTKFFGGRGTVVFNKHGLNVPNDIVVSTETTLDGDHFYERGDGETCFSLSLPSGPRIVSVYGSVPAGSDDVKGKIQVEVSQGEQTLSSYDENTYTKDSSIAFNSFISFYVS